VGRSLIVQVLARPNRSCRTKFAWFDACCHHFYFYDSISQRAIWLLPPSLSTLGFI